jgi:hypothetical protein
MASLMPKRDEGEPETIQRLARPEFLLLVGAGSHAPP